MYLLEAEGNFCAITSKFMPCLSVVLILLYSVDMGRKQKRIRTHSVMETQLVNTQHLLKRNINRSVKTEGMFFNLSRLGL